MTSSGILLKKIDAANYFEQFISEGVYPDGRDTAQFRPITIEQSVDPKVYGSSYVKQGGSCVSCSVMPSLAPASTEPAIVYELKSLEIVPKKIVDNANAHLAALFSRDVFIDSEALCIDNGLRWTLHLEIMAMSADGLLIDALLTAVIAAFLDTKLPEVKYRDSKKEDGPMQDDFESEFDISNIETDSSSYTQLTLKDLPAYSGFLLYSSKSSESGETFVLYDPAKELCDLIDNKCEVIVGNNGRIYSMTASGGVPIAESAISEVLLVAQRRHTAVVNALKRINPRLA
ncbi:Protein EXOS-8 [Aphelenchoides avenae]|nr:Protein EXOS-8 [Aphelenchus avenae]